MLAVRPASAETAGMGLQGAEGREPNGLDSLHVVVRDWVLRERLAKGWQGARSNCAVLLNYC